MNIYLPIAELSVNIFAILALGGVAGLISGVFGVGGGFLISPMLIFIGVPPSVAVSTVANQIVASSVSAFLVHWRRQNVDFKMGLYMMAGGLAGSTVGVALFRWLKQIGHIDIIISILYVFFLGGIGIMMAAESLRSIMKYPASHKSQNKKTLADRLPFKVEFPRSKVNISVIAPVGIGFLIGILVSLTGIGGGFFLVPAMIYLLGMPTNVVIGTSLFQIIFITANVTILQAITTKTVDILLAMILISSSVFGAQLGIRIGNKLPAEQLRGILAAIVLAVSAKLAFGLFTPPTNIYSVSMIDD